MGKVDSPAAGLLADVLTESPPTAGPFAAPLLSFPAYLLRLDGIDGIETKKIPFLCGVYVIEKVQLRNFYVRS